MATRRRRPYFLLGGDRRRTTSRADTVNLKAAGPFTRAGGVGGLSRGPLGNFTGKLSGTIPDNNVDLARITATSQSFAINILRDVVVDLVGIEKNPVVYAITVDQIAGNLIDLALISASSQALPIDVVQSQSPLDQTVLLELIPATTQVFPITPEFEQFVDLALISQTSTAYPVTVEVAGIGQISLTPADLLAIRNALLDWEVEPGTGLTVRQMFRAQYAELVGLTVGSPNRPGRFGYRAAGADSSGTIRVQGDTDGVGGRYKILKRGD